MMQAIKIIFFWATLLSAVLFADASLAQTADKPVVDENVTGELERKIEEIIGEITSVKSKVDAVNTELSTLNTKIKDMNSDVLRLSTGDAVIKKGSSSVALLADELIKVNELVKKREDIIKDLDRLFDEIVEIRKTPENNPHGFTKKLLETATLTIAIPGVALAERGMDDKGKKIASDLPAFNTGVMEFLINSGDLTGGTDIVVELGQLQAALDLLGKDNLAKIPEAEPAAKDLQEALVKFFPTTLANVDNASVTAIMKAAKSLTDYLPKEDEKEKASLRRALLEDQAAYQAILNLLDQINGMKLKDVGLVVRIEEAVLGDTPGHPIIASRWCDATAEMRAKCDGKPECSVPNAVELCGYNPAPSANPRNRAVYVKYTCVRNLESNFEGRYAAKSGLEQEHVNTSFSLEDYVLLRPGKSIVCAPPQSK